MEKIVATYQEMLDFTIPLLADNLYVVDVKTLPDDAGYRIQWLEHKKYAAHDGKEYPDEVWTNIKGDISLVQDLTESHAKNILRMMLRNQRVAAAALEKAMEGLHEAMSEWADASPEDDAEDRSVHISTTTGKVIH